MKILLPIIFLFTSCTTNSNQVEKVSGNMPVMQRNDVKDISDPTNTLTGKTETLELYYVDWSCACANWVTPSDLEKFQYTDLDKHCIFIEPSSKDLELPLYFDHARHKIKVQGQFYVKPDYPKGTVKGEENLDKAKVFRYTKIEVSKKDIKYSSRDDTTLILFYNAIACTCAQWSDRNLIADTEKREYVYLEPANNKLINADELYNGDNLPIEIQVTGQIVASSGYPTGFNPTKGDPEASTVFRYTKIKVLKNGKAKNGR